MEIQMWRQRLAPYKAAVDEIITKFNHVIFEHQMEGTYSPIERVEGRVKSISSIIDKMQMKGVNINDLEAEIQDLAGIRIICQFTEDIERVVKCIEDRADMEIIKRKDYVTIAKNSGYRSYHLIIMYEVNTIHGVKRIPVEIQIRTLAMDFWATVEHSLNYKYRGHIPEFVQDKLINASNAIIVLDREMSSVRDEILDAMNSNRKKEKLVSDILTNLQNLYKVADQREVVTLQNEFYEVFQENDIEKLVHFARQLDLIAEGHGVQQL